MIKRALMLLVVAVMVAACNSSPSQSIENNVGGANVVSSAKSPLKTASPSLTLDWGSKGQPGQVAIGVVLTYGGPKPTITPPTGWQLIRDDSTQTTRQSLYWHAIAPNDPNTASWTFSDPLDAQGAILLLNDVASDSPVDTSSGNTGGSSGGTLAAKSVATTSDGDLILTFN